MKQIPVKRGLGFGSPDSSPEPDSHVEVTIATNAGACFGVVRAIKLGFQAVGKAEKNGTGVYSFGPLIHNPHVVKELKDRGVQTVVGTDEVESGTVILRSHGVTKQAEAELRERGVKVVDATCPLVKKPQRIAQSLGEKGYFLILVGDPNHPEVKGVLSYFGRPDFLVTYDSNAVDGISSSYSKIGVVAQTTIEAKVFDSIVDRAKSRFSEVAVYNTICDATSIRQNEAVLLAQQADVLVVVGGKNSSNTNKLVKICKDLQQDTHHIEDIDEIDASWFAGKRKIGITGGASTPHDFIDRVGEYVVDLLRSRAMG